MTVSNACALLRIEQQVGHADYAVHRRADFVAHVRQELALRLARDLRHLRHAMQLFVAGAQLARTLAQIALGGH